MEVGSSSRLGDVVTDPEWRAREWSAMRWLSLALAVEGLAMVAEVTTLLGSPAIARLSDNSMDLFKAIRGALWQSQLTLFTLAFVTVATVAAIQLARALSIRPRPQSRAAVLALGVAACTFTLTVMMCIGLGSYILQNSSVTDVFNDLSWQIQGSRALQFSLWFLTYLPFSLIPLLLIPATVLPLPLRRRAMLIRCAWAVAVIHIIVFNGALAALVLPHADMGAGFSLASAMRMVCGLITIVLLCMLAVQVRRMASEFAPFPSRPGGVRAAHPSRASTHPLRHLPAALLVTLPAAAAILLWLRPVGEFTDSALAMSHNIAVPSQDLVIRGLLLHACCAAWVVPWALAPRGRAWVWLLCGGLAAVVFSALMLACCV